MTIQVTAAVTGPFLTQQQKTHDAWLLSIPYRVWQNITIHDISFLTKIAKLGMLRLVIFESCEKSNISNLRVFAGGPTLADGAGTSAPGPAREMFKSRAEATRSVRFQPQRPSARLGSRFQFHWLSARPGTRDSQIIFTLRAVSPPRGFVVAAVCSLARAHQCLWAVARCPQPAYEIESVIPRYRPSIPLGAA